MPFARCPSGIVASLLALEKSAKQILILAEIFFPIFGPKNPTSLADFSETRRDAMVPVGHRAEGMSTYERHVPSPNRLLATEITIKIQSRIFF